MFPPFGQGFAFGSLIFVIMNAVQPTVKRLVRSDQTADRQDMLFQDNRDRFDFIIVGGGSTGCSLANKLSEDYSVLLLEAGGPPTVVQQFPILSFFTFANSAIDWVYRSVPQKVAGRGLLDNSILWPSGKSLGGSSALNAMIYIRGNVQGFDDIARTLGDSRWSSQNVLKYFKNMENYNGHYESGDHGKRGHLEIERPTLSPFVEKLKSAAEELGYPERDPNAQGPYTTGFAKMDLYMKKGRRSDAFSESILPILNRKNLVVRKYSTATKLLFGPGTNGVIGVEYERHGRVFKARTNKEVILSAGTFGSPKLLMLAGIGPKEHLEEIGITPRVDLPVGKHLQDKYGALIGPFLVDKNQGLLFNRDLTSDDALDWLRFGTGRFKTSLAEATYAIKTNVSNSNRSDETARPDIHTYAISFSVNEAVKEQAAKCYNLKPQVASFFSLAGKVDSFMQLVTINHQKGHGYVKLRSSNPHDQLVIDPKYLENPDDFQTLVEGLKFSVKLVEDTESFKEIHGRLMPTPIPGCESVPFKSHEYFECLARQVTLTAFKYCGTCPVGKAGDPDAVVDNKFRVFGTEGLRVVDGSVFQQKYVSTNDVTCRMLGLLASDIIKDDINQTDNLLISPVM